MGEKVLTAGELLDGHAALDVQCLDRICLNTYVPILQTNSQVVAFLSGDLGFPFASHRRCSTKIGQPFRKAVAGYTEANSIPWIVIPWIVFGKGDDELAVMAEHLRRQAATGCSGVAAIGVAQEFQRVWIAAEGQTSTGTPRWSFLKADRRVTFYYFYVRHEAPALQKSLVTRKIIRSRAHPATHPSPGSQHGQNHSSRNKAGAVRLRTLEQVSQPIRQIPKLCIPTNKIRSRH